MPIPSVLARKRSIRTNPLVGSKRGKGRAAADPKTVSVLDRVKDIPGRISLSVLRNCFVRHVGKRLC